MEVWMDIILPILSGLVAAIPLVIKLVDVAQKNAKSKNWTALMSLVLKFMAEAETLYEDGVEKKNYVINSIKALEKTLNYDVDEQAISELIDAVVDATKRINVNS